jgi:hypothetical protein
MLVELDITASKCTFLPDAFPFVVRVNSSRLK